MSAAESREKPMVGLIDGMLNAPLCGVVTRQRRRPRVLHAVTMDAFCDGFHVKGRSPFVAACGATGVVLYAVRYSDREAEGKPPYPMLWPPQVRGLPDHLVRCRDCHKAASPKRPRCSYRQPEIEVSR